MRWGRTETAAYGQMAFHKSDRPTQRERVLFIINDVQNNTCKPKAGPSLYTELLKTDEIAK